MKTGQNFSAHFLLSYSLVFALEDTRGLPYSAAGLVVSFVMTDSGGNTVTKTTASGITIDGAEISVSINASDMSDMSGACPYTLTVDGEVMATGTGTIDDSSMVWIVSRNGSVPPELAEQWQGVQEIALEASLNTEYEWWTAGGLIDSAKVVSAYGFALKASKADALVDDTGNTADLTENGSAIAQTEGKGLSGFSDTDYLTGGYNWSTNYAFAFSWREMTKKNYSCLISSQGYAIQALINSSDLVHYFTNNNKTWSPLRSDKGAAAMNPAAAFYNGEDCGAGAAGYGTYTGSNWRIGRAVPVANWAMTSGYFLGLGVYNTALTANESKCMNAVMQWMRKPRFILCCAGDSITAGYQIETPFPETVQEGLADYYPALVNYAVSGYTFTDLVAQQATLDLSLLSVTARHILLVICGSNDLWNLSRTGAQVYADLVSYCQARQTAGWEVVVGTCLPRASGGGAETHRQTYNTLIRANYLTFADGLADIGADSTIGDDGDQNNTTYYQVDKIHPTQAGANLIAGIVQAGIEAML